MTFKRFSVTIYQKAGVVKLVDTVDSKSAGLTPITVQVRSPAKAESSDSAFIFYIGNFLSLETIPILQYTVAM